MLHLVLLTLATFWIWETVRYPLQAFIPGLFNATRALHPLLVATVPVVLLWPDWVSALAVAAVVGMLCVLVDQHLGTPEPIVLSRPRSRGLPPLP